ncbi:MAG TPA: Ig-like domain-containing protein [Candidatus Limnocylindrales bacterium]|nr:Ig-like domain-containing protein [Candidatus Limnocylindrales bacterium]
MRKVAAAALAVPVLAILYLPLLARRSVAARVSLVASVGIVVLVAALGLSRPTPTQAIPPSPPIEALASEAFQTIGTATDLHAAVQIRFSEAMDPRSVGAALSIVPPAAVTTTWNAARTVLTVQPSTHWAAGTYQTITVEPGALAAGGRPMSDPVRAVFVTRPATTGHIAATVQVGSAAAITSGIRIAFDQPVSLDAVRAALRIQPAVAGELVADSGRPDVAADVAEGFTFVPSAALAAGTTYKIALGTVTDADGAAVAAITPVAVRTAAAPKVVRFRPANGTKNVDVHAAFSVRFSEAMDRAATKTAFRVVVAGKPIAGSTRFAEGDTVLVFQPAKALARGTKVVLWVGPTARSARGVAIKKAVAAKIQIQPKAKAVATTTSGSSGGSSGGSGSGSGSGSAVGGGSWGAVETYYLRLMNCTRTGGWVTSTGSCSSPGGLSTAPLRLDSGISTKVSRPYAKRLAVNNLCDHFIGGTPGDRLRAAGYTSYIWAENLGCRSGDPRAAVLGSHLYFQSEKSYGGGHYVNLMNPKYNRVGIGVWVSSGRVRLVVDFYHSL